MKVWTDVGGEVDVGAGADERLQQLRLVERAVGDGVVNGRRAVLQTPNTGRVGTLACTRNTYMQLDACSSPSLQQNDSRKDSREHAGLD